jgi:predicted RecB family nuclease
MTSYVISDPDKPWITLFSSAQLEAIAEAIAAQPHTSTARIYATLDGLPRPLSAAERIELFQQVLKLNPDDQVATVELAAARSETRRGAGSNSAVTVPTTGPRSAGWR